MAWLPYLTPAALLFAETGFLFGLFVPGGDTLLITLGLLAGKGQMSLVWLLPLLFVGSLLGHSLGYFWGRRLGPGLARRVPEMYLKRTQRFLERYGGVAIVLAPQIPYLRTLMPFVAGASGFPWRRYFWLSLLGSLIWTQLITLVGYFLAEVLPGWAVFSIVFGLIGIGISPYLLKWYRRSRRARG